MDHAIVESNKKNWEQAAERFFGRNPLPEYGPLAPTEEELNLLGSVSGKRVLDIGCGSGHSLSYMQRKGASELWGIDVSSAQIRAAKSVLNKSDAKLFQSPMEQNPGLPAHYFDIVYSIYALGWTTNLALTLKNVHTYLKPGGSFVFSWEHPWFTLLRKNENGYLLQGSYHDEGFYNHPGWPITAFMQQLKVSTYVNTLSEQGFHVEQVIEETGDGFGQKKSKTWYTEEKAALIPTTLIIKSTKAK
ncbi:class I SAM-dependent methyltransferase [Shouchella patagoniensis]|uniref:class I SAM-dependent methyltransferase n=1 Tax=Shouchella patagoniensis TaxID=228576 RepID=UPI0009955F02|nr:methyltransferase domain-containing protein [Shouchella patagoniensis]